MSSSGSNLRFNWKFFALWTIATTAGIFLGGFLGVYAGFTASSLVQQAMGQNLSGSIDQIVAVGAGFAIASTITGAVQQWLLQQNSIPAKYWMLFTILGITLAAVAINLTKIISALPINPGGASGGGCIGLGTGLTQWFLLKQHFPRAIWWIPANVIAGAVGLVMLNGFAPLAPLAYVILTAGVLTWILQRQRHLQ